MAIFVPSISFGMPVLASIKPLVKQVMDTHLMITEPIRYVEAFAKAGADILTIHYEACEDVRATLEKIREMRHEDRTFHFTGYTGRGSERISWMKSICFLIMTVHPGVTGGAKKLIPETLDKVRELRGMFKRTGT